MDKLKSFFSKGPVAFSWILLFHSAITLYYIFEFLGEPLSSLVWLQVVWMIALTIAWYFVYRLSKKGAIAYLFIVVLNLLLYFFIVKDSTIQTIALNALFPADVLFSFFILFFFKQLKK